MELIIKYWPLFMEGATTTILLSFFSVVVGVDSNGSCSFEFS